METKSKLDLYTKYVLIEPKRVSWNKLCDIIKVDHKQINRFLCNFNDNPWKVKFKMHKINWEKKMEK